MVECFFRDLSVYRLRQGVFPSLPDLITALEKYLALHNQALKPFVWTAQAKDILAKVTRGRKSRAVAKNSTDSNVMRTKLHYTRDGDRGL
jgi:hypothetical protein